MYPTLKISISELIVDRY